MLAFWYKNDLRAFLTTCLGRGELVAHLDWTDYKRSIVGQLVDCLAADQHRHFDDLLNLLLATAEITDPSHLKRIEDGDKEYADASAALDALRVHVEPYRRLRDEVEEANRRREADRIKAEMDRAMTDKLAELKDDFYKIVAMAPQPRGYALENFSMACSRYSTSTPRRLSALWASKSTVRLPSRVSSCWRPSGKMHRRL
jgi:hypothetical protein